MGLIFAVLFGLAFGSFLSSLTYRSPRGLTVLAGRSFCAHCKHRLRWYDNIPLISFILLKGRCRYCKRKISFRYPLIEIVTTTLFVMVFWFLSQRCWEPSNLYLCTFREFGFFALPYLLLNILLIISIFIIDLEHTIIPDEIVFAGFGISFLVLILTGPDLYVRLLASFCASLFFLFLNLITRGRGMGLGDVKFALYGGLFFKPVEVVIWIFLSFLIGAFVGVILIFLGKTKFGSRIPFGPFMAVSFIITLIFGRALYPYAIFW